MQTIRKNPIAASLASPHLAGRTVRARKGKGSFEFGTVEEAVEWDEETAWDRFAHHVADEECRDNYRSAYADDATAVAEYDAAREDGCCGSSDMAYLIAGRLFFIGCNYGH